MMTISAIRYVAACLCGSLHQAWCIACVGIAAMTLGTSGELSAFWRHHACTFRVQQSKADRINHTPVHGP